MKKLNKKGFTLIELIAVIVILSIILVFVVPNLLDTYKRSKLKTEKAFVDQLSKGIESYITLYNADLNFVADGKAKKIVEKKDKNNAVVTSSYDVDVYKVDIKVEDIIKNNIIEASEYRNPGNREDTCSQDAIINVYRDSDFVYCFKMPPMDCLTKDFIDFLLDEKQKEKQKENPGEVIKRDDKLDYVLDTCIWKKIENGE